MPSSIRLIILQGTDNLPNLAFEVDLERNDEVSLNLVLLHFLFTVIVDQPLDDVSGVAAYLVYHMELVKGSKKASCS